MAGRLSAAARRPVFVGAPLVRTFWVSLVRTFGRCRWCELAGAICAGWRSVARTEALSLCLRRIIGGNWWEVAIGWSGRGCCCSAAGVRLVAIGVGLSHCATLLIVGLEAEGRLGGGVGVDGMSDAAGRCREALLVTGPMLVCGDN